jgi:hypothetical protein
VDRAVLGAICCSLRAAHIFSDAVPWLNGASIFPERQLRRRFSSKAKNEIIFQVSGISLAFNTKQDMQDGPLANDGNRSVHCPHGTHRSLIQKTNSWPNSKN